MVYGLTNSKQVSFQRSQKQNLQTVKSPTSSASLPSLTASQERCQSPTRAASPESPTHGAVSRLPIHFPGRMGVSHVPMRHHSPLTPMSTWKRTLARSEIFRNKIQVANWSAAAGRQGCLPTSPGPVKEWS